MTFSDAKGALTEFLLAEVHEYVDGFDEEDFEAVWDRNKGQPDHREAIKQFATHLLTFRR